MKKRHLYHMLLAVAMGLLMPLQAQAQVAGDTFTEGGFSCKVLTADASTKSGLAEITGAATVGETLEIPASLKHTFGGSEWTFAVGAIGEKAFADNTTIKTVKFPAKAESSLTVIGPLAFQHCSGLQSMNLEDTKLEVLESLFSKDESDEITISGLKTLKLPETLKTIKKYALQFLDLRDVEFPSSVTTLEDRVLEGCIYLKTFTWKNAKVTSIPTYTFWGCYDKLERVTILTESPLEPGGLTDKHFSMCDKALLNVYVTAASLENLAKGGYTNVTSKYSTLVVAEGQYAAGFESKNKAADGYYYKSYFNTASATWFPADKFDVYSAVVSDNKVVMKPATAEDGYYKVKKYDGSNSKESVCIIRSSDKDAQYEIKGTGADVDKSTLPADNHLLIADGSQKGSKINFMFQLAKNKAGNVAFYRVTSGTFKVGSVYIDAVPFLARPVDYLEIEIEGEATAINKVQAAEADNEASYNLAGQKVGASYRGFVIKGGKKYIRHAK